jgi:spore germination protein GerM
MKISTLQNKIWLGLAAAAVIGGVGIAAIINNGSSSSPTPPVSNPTVTSPQSSVNSVAVERQVTLYWIASKDKRFVAVPTPILAPSTEAALKTALADAIAQPPKQPNLYSAIPAHVKILSFAMQGKDGKDIYLDLSKEFTSGGGSASMNGRVVQILYTATSLNPEANLFLSVEGKPLNYLGGEGLEITQPITRANVPLEF